MKFGSGDDFGQLFHIGWLDVNDIETLILDVEVPQVYSQIVTADKGLPIAVDGYAVDVIGVGVCIVSARHSSNDGVMVSQSW